MAISWPNAMLGRTIYHGPYEWIWNVVACRDQAQWFVQARLGLSFWDNPSDDKLVCTWQGIPNDVDLPLYLWVLGIFPRSFGGLIEERDSLIIRPAHGSWIEENMNNMEFWENWGLVIGLCLFFVSFYIWSWVLPWGVFVASPSPAALQNDWESRLCKRVIKKYGYWEQSLSSP